MIEGVVGMMTSYKRLKEEALQYYQELLNVARNAEMPEEDKSLKILSKQAKNIEEDNFCLMIAGEAKSGKSTFINAYLGTEILPMDVLQCTSSVIEIRYGEDFRLYATYADGRMKDVSGEVAIKEFLTETASLDDEYRDIPITAINYEVIVKYKDKKIMERYIQDLLKGVERENIYNLTKEVYEQKIRDYIEKMQPKWGEIVVKLEIEYPFEDKDMKKVRIIDSPGVNAAGKVGDVTHEYIKSAQAIMFLRPITGQAIEAISFKEFLESSSVDRNKNAMFLILTNSAGVPAAKRDRAYQEFVKIFGTQNDGGSRGIEHNQIIHVDSKAKLYLNAFKALSTDEINEEIERGEQEGVLEDFITKAWFKSKCEKEAFLQELERISNFNAISQSLNGFGRKAQYLALSDFLGRMLKVYGKIEERLGEKITNYKIKLGNPRELDDKIEELNSELESIETRMNIETDHIYAKYGGDKGFINQRVEEAISEYKKAIEEIDEDNNSNFDKLEKLSFDQIKRLRLFEEEIQKKIIDDCNERLKMVLEGSNAVNYVSLEPDFSKEDIEKIKQIAEAAAYEQKETKGSTFEKPHMELVYSRHRFYVFVKNDIVGKIEKIENQVKDELSKFLTKILDAYTEGLKQNSESLKGELEKVRDDKKKVEVIKDLISNFEEIKASIEFKERKISELKGGIDYNE